MERNSQELDLDVYLDYSRRYGPFVTRRFTELKKEIYYNNKKQEMGARNPLSVEIDRFNDDLAVYLFFYII